MDNCSVHHVDEVKSLLEESGIVVMFLPPNSPDLNAIEEAFSYVKQYLQRHGELLQPIADPTDIKEAFLSITKDHCNRWISHSLFL